MPPKPARAAQCSGHDGRVDRVQLSECHPFGRKARKKRDEANRNERPQDASAAQSFPAEQVEGQIDQRKAQPELDAGYILQQERRAGRAADRQYCLGIDRRAQSHHEAAEDQGERILVQAMPLHSRTSASSWYLAEFASSPMRCLCPSANAVAKLPVIFRR